MIHTPSDPDYLDTMPAPSRRYALPLPPVKIMCDICKRPCLRLVDVLITDDLRQVFVGVCCQNKVKRRPMGCNEDGE